MLGLRLALVLVSVSALVSVSELVSVSALVLVSVLELVSIVFVFLFFGGCTLLW